MGRRLGTAGVGVVHADPGRVDHVAAAVEILLINILIAGRYPSIIFILQNCKTAASWPAKIEDYFSKGINSGTGILRKYLKH